MTITLPEDVAARAEALAAAEGVPLSAWMGDAIERHARYQERLAAVREWEIESGEPTPEQLARVRARLAEADARTLAGIGPAVEEGE